MTVIVNSETRRYDHDSQTSYFKHNLIRWNKFYGCSKTTNHDFRLTTVLTDHIEVSPSDHRKGRIPRTFDYLPYDRDSSNQLQLINILFVAVFIQLTCSWQQSPRSDYYPCHVRDSTVGTVAAVDVTVLASIRPSGDYLSGDNHRMSSRSIFRLCAVLFTICLPVCDVDRHAQPTDRQTRRPTASLTDYALVGLGPYHNFNFDTISIFYH